MGDHPVGADHVACRHRRYPGGIVVDLRQVVVELPVDLDQIVGQREAEAELRGDRRSGVPEDGEVPTCCRAVTGGCSPAFGERSRAGSRAWAVSNVVKEFQRRFGSNPNAMRTRPHSRDIQGN